LFSLGFDWFLARTSEGPMGLSFQTGNAIKQIIPKIEREEKGENGK
jgi:hypothetical protein